MGKIKLNWPLIGILGLGAFLRLYRIAEYMIFLGDEGRDILIVWRLLAQSDPILIGPGTSVGNMYLGPLYYYLIAPALFLARYNPVGPAVLVALLGVATIYFVYFVARRWFTPTAGLLASFLYAISPTVIIFSHSSWNPNIMPFFALLTMYSVWQVWQEKKYYWLVVLGAAYAAVLQSHYLGLLLLPVILVFLIWTLRNLKFIGNWRLEIRNFKKYFLIGLIIFLVLMSPLLIFDIRHNWLNLRALKAFISEPQGSFSFTLLVFLQNLWLNFRFIMVRLLAGRNELVGTFLAVFFVGVIIYRFFEKSLGHAHCRFLLVWLGFGILGLSFYRHEVYDHYLGFLFPAPFLFLGGLSGYLSERFDRFGKFLFFLGFFVLVAVNLVNNPLRYPPNRQLQRSKEVAQKIFEEAKGEKFNLAVLAERNYEDGYRYFLEVWGAKVYHADVWNKEATISEQLFVVCERPEAECHPTSDPKAEVANFGMSKIVNEWNIGGIRLYKLEHADKDR